MEIAFFTSTGRTGTDFFSDLFNEKIQNSWSLHEPKPAFRKRGYTLLNRQHTQFEKYYFSIPRYMRHFRREENCYVETNYHLFAAIPLLRDAFPESKVFHIVRDGRDTVTSWLNRYRYITNDHITPYHNGDLEAQALWPDWNPLQKLAWYWKTVNIYATQNSPDMVIKFEELFKGSPDHLLSILEKFDTISYDKDEVINHLKQPINRNHIEFFPKYKNWPKAWKDQFWNIAGDTMVEFGYTKE